MKKNNIDIGLLIIGSVVTIVIVALILAYLSLNTDEGDDLPTLHSEAIVRQEIKVIERAGSAPDAPEIKEPILSDEDIMAIVVMREAEGEELIGKIAVAATILNRCDYYGLTVESVVFSPNQYSFSFDTVPSEDCYKAVRIAKRERELFPETMMWFSNEGFPAYGKPYLKIQDHYFNYLKEEQ